MFGCNISGSNITGCNISGSNITGCNISGSNITGCNISGSNVTGCNIFRVSCNGTVPLHILQQTFDEGVFSFYYLEGIVDLMGES
ncbi:MAG: pentapeptide repeat-containing protein [Desulfamplus sp.]|nr:pentapeptide repeat-containing protein [Desulfamplus sp.]